MVATLAGLGALLFGLALLLLPLLVSELSRPGDSAWGALVLVLALVLVTSAERLSGSPMLAVISGGLLVGRLSVEVGRGRWRQLTPEEKGRLGTRERWLSSLSQVQVALAGLLEPVGRQGAALLARWRQSGQPKASGKRWVRPEVAAGVPSEAEASAAPEVTAAAEETAPAEETAAAEETAPAEETAAPEGTAASEVIAATDVSTVPEMIEVSDFDAIDALLQAAPEPAAASGDGREGDVREREEGGAG
jgi:hypothetical protein